jgi:hypothetical protein
MATGAIMLASRSRTVRSVVLSGVLLVVLMPMLVAGGVLSALSHTTQACQAAGAVEQPAGDGPVAAGRYAQPLHLQPGRWYEVGATEYGGPGDPSSTSYGSIPDPNQSHLPSHPDTFAELSVLDSNPPNHGTFTFADANALGNLPYMTALRVAHAGHQAVLYKRDVGYGQGPGQTIAGGEPYRLDVWWQAAQPLHVSKSAVQVQLAPPGGSAPTLGDLPASSALDSTALAACELPGPGRYVSIYANAAHAFVYVAGLRLDTIESPAYDTGPNSGKPGARWRVYPSVPDWATWTVRHPPGL